MGKIIGGCRTNPKIVLLDIVKDEINNGGDDDKLRVWLNSKEKVFVSCSHKSETVIEYYGKIMQYITACGYYNSTGINSWMNGNIADPWLVATAKANDFSLVTLEQSAGILATDGKCGKVKIPDVAKHFGVETINVW